MACCTDEENMRLLELSSKVCGRLGFAAAVLASALSAQPCSNPVFQGLGSSATNTAPLPEVSASTLLVWSPACTAAALQAYVNGKLYQAAPATSGTVSLRQLLSGLANANVVAELKLWAGGPVPSSDLWVKVIDESASDCSHLEFTSLGDNKTGAFPLTAIPLPTVISWQPTRCVPLSLQVYAGDAEAPVLDAPNPQSGTISVGAAIQGANRTPIVAKLWNGANQPDSQRWFLPPPSAFTDGFETDAGWGICQGCEEIVNGNTCYAAGIGRVERLTGLNLCGQTSLQVFANAQNQLNSNHLIAAKKLSRFGRGGVWVYSVDALIPASMVASGQTGPEISVQNTRFVGPGDFRTSTAGVQYLPQTRSWNVWGNATWQRLALPELQPDTWYTLTIEADFDANRYLRISLSGGGINITIPGTEIAIAQEAKFAEEGFVLTLESENLYTACQSRTQYAVYYDQVKFLPGNGDLNSDGVVDCSDFTPIKSSFGLSCNQLGHNPLGDLNNDGIVDVRDEALFSRKLPARARCQ